MRRVARAWPALLILVMLCVATTAYAAPGQTDPGAVATAIQGVIQQANQEQSQALSSGDPSVMRDTATAAYYLQLMQTNQALAAAGATNIDLTQLTWGTIQNNGTGSTATTVETWITTFGDGTTLESIDTNVYSLTNLGGAWLIAADNHPIQITPGVGGPTPPSPQPTPRGPAPMVPVGENTSHNWSGYAATGGPFTGVNGTWTVPQPTLTGAPGVGATWVGIGGVTGPDLIQAGTQDATPGGNQAQFQVWIEMLPAASQQVPLAVAPGDSVTVSIQEQAEGSGDWQITITNNTSNQSYQTTANYTSSESSAEWIEEAPSGPGGILPLDNFNSVSFTAAFASQGGGNGVDLNEAGAQAITMLNATNQPLAVPSSIGSDASSFNVVRTSVAATTR